MNAEYYLPFAQDPDRYMRPRGAHEPTAPDRTGDDDSPRGARDRCGTIHPDAQAVPGTGSPTLSQSRFNTALLGTFARSRSSSPRSGFTV